MRFPVKSAVLMIGIFALSGCDRSHDEAHEHPPADAPTAPHDDGDGHDHPHGDHDHDDPHTETFFGPDAAGHEHDDEDEHAHDDEEPHEH
ncbi:MAG TPA: hypothetical protein VMQ83_06125 [Gammaproteobacteria bacterium]|nr:hypothetical protein [Gammaproteobacteria bacterium]